MGKKTGKNENNKIGEFWYNADFTYKNESDVNNGIVISSEKPYAEYNYTLSGLNCNFTFLNNI